MGEPVPVSLGKQSNPAENSGAARLINMYARDAGEEARNVRFPLHAVDGLTGYANLVGADGSGVRAMLELQDLNKLLTVAGQLLFEVADDGSSVTQTQIGGITQTGIVTMARNRNANPQVAIVCDGAYYIWQASVLTLVSDPDLPPPVSVDWLRGYFILPIADGRMYASSIDDSGVAALDFARAESNPDGLLRGKVRGSEFIAYGPKTSEFFAVDANNANFPLSVRETSEIGLLAASSVATIEQTHAFVAHDGSVRMWNGYQAKRVSNDAVEWAIENEPFKSLIDGVAHGRGGTQFYCVSGSTFSWELNTTTGLWHERVSKGLNRWRCSSYAKLGEKHIFGHYALPKLYEARPTLFDEDGDELICTVIPPSITAWPHPIQVDAIHIDAETGVGNPADPLPANADPHIMLSKSIDGGKSFGATRRLRLGTLGQRLQRVVSRTFGRFRSQYGVTFKISCSAAVLRTLNGMAIEVQKLKA